MSLPVPVPPLLYAHFTFKNEPSPKITKIQASAIANQQFIDQSLSELLQTGCVRVVAVVEGSTGLVPTPVESSGMEITLPAAEPVDEPAESTVEPQVIETSSAAEHHYPLRSRNPPDRYSK